MQPRMKRTVVRQFADIMDLPPEAVMNSVKVSIVGNMEAIIENHKGLLKYTTECVKIKAPQGFIIVTGTNLFIQFLSGDEIKISGQLLDVQLA